MSLMKGAGANILRGVAGAGVLAGFDKFQQICTSPSELENELATFTSPDHFIINS